MHPNDRRNRGDLPFWVQILIQSRRCSVQKYFRTTKRRALCSSKNWFQSIFSKLPLRSINQKFLRTETNSRWKSRRITSTLTDSGFILYSHRNSSNLKLLSQNDLVNLHKLCCCPRQSRGIHLVVANEIQDFRSTILTRPQLIWGFTKQELDFSSIDFTLWSHEVKARF